MKINEIIIKLVMCINTLIEWLESAHKIQKIEGKLKKYPSTNGVPTNTTLKIYFLMEFLDMKKTLAVMQ